MKTTCEIPQPLGYLYQTNKIQWNWKILFFGFHNTKANQKIKGVVQLKDHQIVQSLGAKMKQN